ncbi:hypothetical protein EVAR_64709_1 [Eumeta japonica]|uniref:Uncharacterized protein n=1 Tax=Eumeta variegata TaxID=151549 RepID=A0A4C1ZP95_EUMVA|nr:hypothetical protein EVAR_64709_1 [Eumeta japonica]
MSAEKETDEQKRQSGFGASNLKNNGCRKAGSAGELLRRRNAVLDTRDLQRPFLAHVSKEIERQCPPCQTKIVIKTHELPTRSYEGRPRDQVQPEPSIHRIDSIITTMVMEAKTQLESLTDMNKVIKETIISKLQNAEYYFEEIKIHNKCAQIFPETAADLGGCRTAALRAYDDVVSDGCTTYNKIGSTSEKSPFPLRGSAHTLIMASEDKTFIAEQVIDKESTTPGSIARLRPKNVRTAEGTAKVPTAKKTPERRAPLMSELRSRQG